MSDDKWFTFLWRIENFSYCLEPQNSFWCLHSPDFSVLKRNKFFLRLDPRDRERLDHISYRIVSAYYGKRKSLVKPGIEYELSLLDTGGSIQESLERSTNYGERKFLSRDILTDKKDTLLPQDTLTLACRMWKDDEKLEANRRYGRTRIGVESKSVILTVDDFSSFGCSSAKSFHIEPISKKYPSLKLELSASRGYFFDERIQIEISQENHRSRNLVICKISLKDVLGRAFHSAVEEHYFDGKDGKHSWLFPLNIPKRKLMEIKYIFLPDDRLSLLCQTAISIGEISTKLEDMDYGLSYSSVETIPFGIVNGKEGSSSLQTDLYYLYERNSFCDATLQVRDTLIPAHKAVLCSRSSVLFDMFEHDMKGTGIVEIPDLDVETARQMIHFLYSDYVQELQWNIASKLHFAAHKYKIQTLKQICSSFIRSQLCDSNICDVLILSDVHDDADLKRAAQDFIYNSESEIVSTDQWQNFEQNYPLLAMETLRNVHLKYKR